MDVKIEDPILQGFVEIGKKYFPDESEQQILEKTLDAIRKGNISEIKDKVKNIYEEVTKEIENSDEYKKLEKILTTSPSQSPLPKEAEGYISKLVEEYNEKLSKKMEDFQKKYPTMYEQFKAYSELEESIIEKLVQGKETAGISYPIDIDKFWNEELEKDEYKDVKKILTELEWDKKKLEKFVKFRRYFNLDAVEIPRRPSYYVLKLLTQIAEEGLNNHSITEEALEHIKHKNSG
jgi:vacuolar-type H+-ATPase subunit I/STV1